MSVRTLLLVCLLGAACGPAVEDAPGPERERLSADVLQVPPEVVERGGFVSIPAQARVLHEWLEVTGRIQLDEDRTARVGSPAEGRVTGISVNLGDRVERGDALLRIHSHELIVARSDFAKARADLAAREKQLRYAQTELARAKRLFEAKALSEREWIFAESEVTAAEAEVQRAHSELARAEHYLDHLGASPGDTAGGDLTVWAPIAGVVLERRVTIGTVVNPADDLLLLSDLSSLWVVGEVPERQATAVVAGQEARIAVTAFPGETFAARVFHIGETLDPELRTVLVRCRLENPGGKLRPEMYATIYIGRGEGSPAVVVPAGAIQTVDGEPVVFVDLGEGRFEKRRIESARTVEGWTEIQSGVIAGERVVSEGSFLVKSEFLRSRFEEE